MGGTCLHGIPLARKIIAGNIWHLTLWITIVLDLTLLVSGDAGCKQFNGTQCPADFRPCLPQTTEAPIVLTTQSSSNHTKGDDTTEESTLTTTTTTNATTPTLTEIYATTDEIATTESSIVTDGNSSLLNIGNGSNLDPAPQPENIIFCEEIEADETDPDLIPIIAGSVGGVVFVVVLILVVCCCCRCRQGDQNTEAGVSRRRRPLSQLLWEKIKPKNEKHDHVPSPLPRADSLRLRRPGAYENTEVPDTLAIVTEAQQVQDKMTRYHTDPTKSTKEMKTRKEEPFYENQSSIRLQEFQKSGSSKRLDSVGDPIPDVPAPPPPVSGRQTRKKPSPSAVHSSKDTPPAISYETHPNRAKQKEEAPLNPVMEEYVDMDGTREEPMESYENLKFQGGKTITEEGDHQKLESNDEDTKEDYENVPAKKGTKIQKQDSNTDEEIEDYENAPGIDYVNVPEKRTQKK